MCVSSAHLGSGRRVLFTDVSVLLDAVTREKVVHLAVAPERHLFQLVLGPRVHGHRPARQQSHLCTDCGTDLGNQSPR